MVKVLAIYPVYIDGKGDCTVVITKYKGEKIIYKPIDSVLDDLMNQRLVNKKALIKITKEITGMDKNYPIYPTSSEMLVPMKVRKIKITGDKAYGYINEEYIDSVYKEQIRTKGGEVFILLEKESTFNKRREQGDKIKEEFDQDPHLAMIYSRDLELSERIEKMKRDIDSLANKYGEFPRNKKNVILN